MGEKTNAEKTINVLNEKIETSSQTEKKKKKLIKHLLKLRQLK